jgi:tetratricopeptide (TPR) repeat protein
LLTVAPEHSGAEDKDAVRQGVDLVGRGRYNEAEKKFSSILKADPSNDVARVNLVSLYVFLGKHELAKSHIEFLKRSSDERLIFLGYKFEVDGLTKQKHYQEAVDATWTGLSHLADHARRRALLDMQWIVLREKDKAAFTRLKNQLEGLNRRDDSSLCDDQYPLPLQRLLAEQMVQLYCLGTDGENTAAINLGEQVLELVPENADAAAIVLAAQLRSRGTGTKAFVQVTAGYDQNPHELKSEQGISGSALTSFRGVLVRPAYLEIYFQGLGGDVANSYGDMAAGYTFRDSWGSLRPLLGTWMVDGSFDGLYGGFRYWKDLKGISLDLSFIGENGVWNDLANNGVTATTTFGWHWVYATYQLQSFRDNAFSNGEVTPRSRHLFQLDIRPHWKSGHWTFLVEAGGSYIVYFQNTTLIADNTLYDFKRKDFVAALSPSVQYGWAQWCAGLYLVAEQSFSNQKMTGYNKNFFRVRTSLSLSRTF